MDKLQITFNQAEATLKEKEDAFIRVAQDIDAIKRIIAKAQYDLKEKKEILYNLTVECNIAKRILDDVADEIEEQARQ